MRSQRPWSFDGERSELCRNDVWRVRRAPVGRWPMDAQSGAVGSLDVHSRLVLPTRSQRSPLSLMARAGMAQFGHAVGELGLPARALSDVGPLCFTGPAARPGRGHRTPTAPDGRPAPALAPVAPPDLRQAANAPSQTTKKWLRTQPPSGRREPTPRPARPLAGLLQPRPAPPGSGRRHTLRTLDRQPTRQARRAHPRTRPRLAAHHQQRRSHRLGPLQHRRRLPAAGHTVLVVARRPRPHHLRPARPPAPPQPSTPAADTNPAANPPAPRNGPTSVNDVPRHLSAISHDSQQTGPRTALPRVRSSGPYCLADTPLA